MVNELGGFCLDDDQTRRDLLALILLPATDLCRMAIRACQIVGFWIAEIRMALAGLRADRVPRPAAWDRLSNRLQQQVAERVGGSQSSVAEPACVNRMIGGIDR